MHVEVNTQIAHNEWERLVADDGTATFFHTLEWAQLIERTIAGWTPLYLRAMAGDRLVGALELMIRRRHGALVIASMPFGTYGGVLLSPDAPKETPQVLTDRFFEIARSPRVAYGEIVDFSARIASPKPGSVACSTLETQILDLEPGYRELWRGFKPSNRNKIRKAKQLGITVRKAESKSELVEYHSILSYCCSKWGRRKTVTTEFFAQLPTLGPSRGTVWLAELKGEIVAGLLNFSDGGEIMNWGSVSTPAGYRTAANNLLHAVAIEDAVDGGAQRYNFGSNPGLPGVGAFKASFGTRPFHYHAYRIEKAWYRAFRRPRFAKHNGHSDS